MLGALVYGLNELAEALDDPDPASVEPLPPEGGDGIYVSANLFDPKFRNN